MANKQIKDLTAKGTNAASSDKFAIDDAADATKYVTAAQVRGYILSATDTDDISEGSSNLYDKTVAFSGGTNVTVGGTYPNFVITDNSGTSDYADPMTTQGDILVGNVSGDAARLAIGTNGQVLTSNGTTASWQDASNAVDSVNGQTGVVVLDSDDISEGSSNLYDKTVAFTGGTNVTIGGTYPNFSITDNSQADVITTRGDVVIGNTSGVAARLGIGTSGQVLTSDGTDVSWEDAAGSDPITTKGDVIVGDSGGSSVRLAVGTDDYVLTADSTAANGVAWKAAGAGGGGIGEFNGTESLTVTGTNAIGVGIATASGNYSIAIGGLSNSASTTGAIAIGADTSVAGNDGIAIGGGANIASGKAACLAIGKNADVNDFRSMAIGDSTRCDERYQIALGYNTTVSRAGEFGRNISLGVTDRYDSRLDWNGQTSNDTQTEIYLRGLSSERATLRSTDQVVPFDLVVAAGDYTGNEGARFTIKGLIQSHGGTTSFVGTPSVVQDFADTGLSSTSVAVEADDTNDALVVKVTGVAATTIKWTAIGWLLEQGS